HPRITRAMSTPIIPHRGKEFSQLFLKQIERLKSVFQTKNDIFILCGSGTAAMEAGISNTVGQNDKVLCLVNGKFSERFVEIAKNFRAKTIVLEFEWGKKIDVQKVRKALEENPDVKAVTMVFNETSTGVKNPVKEVGEIVKKTPAVFIVDTISALGGDEFRTDEWNVDICATGSQKCFALPPGLAFVSVSKKAWKVIEKNKGHAYYLNLLLYRKDKAHAPYTPPVTLVYGLKEALDMIEEEGLQTRIKRHNKLALIVRERIKEMGLELFPESEEICSATVTAINVPSGVNPGDIRRIMRETYDIEIAGGQAHLGSSIIRIGHMGIVKEKEIYATLKCLELTLKELKNKKR
ncbi:MAG: pyridoxal-phosphate-dependent aminotransferase family protein, partial [Candidatus Methanofastidiosia archaeon]